MDGQFTFAKFDSQKRDKYLGCLRQGLRHGQAARAAGVSRCLVWAYVKAHPEFQEDIDRAEADACDLIEEALHNTALDGNVTAQLVWLYNRSHGRWVDKRQPATTTIIKTDDGPTTDEIKRRLEELVSKGKPQQ